MHLKALALATLLTGGVALVGTAPAVAAPLSGVGPAPAAAAQQLQQSLVVEVQRRRRGRRGGINPGAAAAIGVIGAIGTMMAIDSARKSAAADAEYDEAIEYCIRTYKSYDIESQTYLGYDGYRHSCP